MSAQPGHCVVTGSASGIGAALAERLISAGWHVTGIDRDPLPKRLLGRMGFVQLDLSDPASVEGMALPPAPAPVSAFVHCAGIMRADSDASLRADLGAGIWRLHVGVGETLARQLAPQFPAHEGRIVFVSSRAAAGRAGRALYSASKAALDGLARSLAAEFVRRGVTVNVVAPGSTATPMLQDPAREGAPVMALPIGRLIEADEVAALIEFLIGRHSGAITGQTIFICGGSSIAGI